MLMNITEVLPQTSENTSEDTKEVKDNSNPLSYAGVIIIPVILIAVIGNALTICSFIRDKGLHKTCNVYILNLAIADFLIGAITMPIYLTYTFGNNVWIFGYHFCKVFLLFDMATVEVTAILMILISYDRLSLLRHWSTYYKTHSPQKAYLKCALAWIFVFVLNGPATIGWDIWTGNSTDPNDCEAQFYDNVAYISIMTIVQFVIPLTALIIIHIFIVYEIRKLIQTREQLISTHSGSIGSSDSVVCLELKTDSCKTKLHRRSTDIHKENTKKRNGTKAAKSLAILTIAFIVLWAPYGIIIVFQSICPTCICVILIESCTWVLWFKSALNPFLYAYNSNRFRENFKYFLCCRRRLGYRANYSFNS
ncbi:HRH3 [Mytilus coruscus]|uniref:HRH3 n=1 Tax=Mytilus coruscus TaxID=42192 RepID=A0A6J8E567_MYTCO|nr:HRH3 [Mytilus coruscus]